MAVDQWGGETPHNGLPGLAEGDPHTQYFDTAGVRPLTTNGQDLTMGGGRLVGMTIARNLQAGSTYTFVPSDANKIVAFTGTVVATIPPYTEHDIPIGSSIEIHRMGSGTVTIAPGTNVILRSAGNRRTIAERYGAASLYRLALTEWLLVGALL